MEPESTTRGGGTATKQQLLARVGLENEAHLKATTAGSARKQRMMEKMMVAELHHMKGELTQEKSALSNENQALKDLITQLKSGVDSDKLLQQRKPDRSAASSRKPTSFPTMDVCMEDVAS